MKVTKNEVQCATKNVGAAFELKELGESSLILVSGATKRQIKEAILAMRKKTRLETYLDAIVIGGGQK